MEQIYVSSNKMTFETEGDKPFFWLGDTCWSAPWKAKWDDWEKYVSYRSKQGFNILQVCSIPYEECSDIQEAARKPFEIDNNGFCDFNNYNVEYFSFLHNMIDYANNKGFTVALVLLWWNYIPNARLWTHPMPRSVMTLQQAKNYVKFMADLLKDNAVVWILTGDDTHYGEGVPEFCKEIGKFLKQYVTRNRLLTIHPSISSAKFYNIEPWLDFNMIQSSHFDAYQNLAYELSREEFNFSPSKPVVNAEICYEWHKGFDYGHRFNRKDVRQAFWWSVLEGSLAGITYGAEGIFNWIGDDEIERNAYPNICISWERAMHNSGAEDVVRGKKLLEQIEWFRLRPSSERIISKTARHVSCASSANKLLAYFPPYIPPTEGFAEVDLSGIPGDAVAKWWNPANGNTDVIGPISKRMTFMAPDKRDSLLIIE